MSIRSDGSVSLTVNMVEADDCGEYTVEAVNENGRDSKSTILTVHGMYMFSSVCLHVFVYMSAI